MAALQGFIWASTGNEPPTLIGVVDLTHPELANRQFARKLREVADVIEEESEGSAVDVATLEAMFMGGDAPNDGA